VNQKNFKTKIKNLKNVSRNAFPGAGWKDRGTSRNEKSKNRSPRPAKGAKKNKKNFLFSVRWTSKQQKQRETLQGGGVGNLEKKKVKQKTKNSKSDQTDARTRGEGVRKGNRNVGGRKKKRSHTRRKENGKKQDDIHRKTELNCGWGSVTPHRVRGND